MEDIILIERIIKSDSNRYKLLFGLEMVSGQYRLVCEPEVLIETGEVVTDNSVLNGLSDMVLKHIRFTEYEYNIGGFFEIERIPNFSLVRNSDCIKPGTTDKGIR